MYPGEMELTRAKSRHSFASDFAKWMQPDFATLYEVCSWGKFAMCPDMEAVMTRLPVPRSLKWCPTALAQLYVPVERHQVSPPQLSTWEAKLH